MKIIYYSLSHINFVYFQIEFHSIYLTKFYQYGVEQEVSYPFHSIHLKLKRGPYPFYLVLFRGRCLEGYICKGIISCQPLLPFCLSTAFLCVYHSASWYLVFFYFPLASSISVCQCVFFKRIYVFHAVFRPVMSVCSSLRLSFHHYVIINPSCGVYETYVRTYECTYIRTYVHTYIHTRLHTYIHTYIHT